MESKISKLNKDKPLQNILVLGMEKKRKRVTYHILNVSISTLGVYMKRIYQELGTSENFKILSNFKNGQMFIITGINQHRL